MSMPKELDLGEILTEAQIVPELQAANRWEAIDELINILIGSGKIKPEHKEAVTAVIRKRETSMSTGIGFGIGIPHATTDLLGSIVCALGRSKQQVDFDAVDGQPVNLVFLFLIPQGQLQEHLGTLTNLAKVLQDTKLRQALEHAPDAAAILKVLRGQRI